MTIDYRAKPESDKPNIRPSGQQVDFIHEIFGQTLGFTVESLQKDGSFSKQEAQVYYHLLMAWHAYDKIRDEPKSERRRFVEKLKELQTMLMVRIVRRRQPRLFIGNYKDE